MGYTYGMLRTGKLIFPFTVIILYLTRLHAYTPTSCHSKDWYRYTPVLSRSEFSLPTCRSPSRDAIKMNFQGTNDNSAKSKTKDVDVKASSGQNIFSPFFRFIPGSNPLATSEADQNVNRYVNVEIYSDISFVSESFRFFLKKKIKVPDIQRIATQERIDEYVQKIVSHYEICKNDSNREPIPYLGCISIGLIDDTYNILDGQHRYRALSDFYIMKNETVDFNITHHLHFEKMCHI